MPELTFDVEVCMQRDELKAIVTYIVYTYILLSS